jgi:hypothetical protein
MQTIEEDGPSWHLLEPCLWSSAQVRSTLLDCQWSKCVRKIITFSFVLSTPTLSVCDLGCASNWINVECRMSHHDQMPAVGLVLLAWQRALQIALQMLLQSPIKGCLQHDPVLLCPIDHHDGCDHPLVVANKSWMHARKNYRTCIKADTFSCERHRDCCISPLALLDVHIHPKEEAQLCIISWRLNQV